MSDVSDNSSIRSEVADKMLEKARQAKPQDAIDLLKADHKEALEVYAKFFKAESPEEKQSLAAEVCLALSVHMRIEEDIFYPAVSSALGQTEEREDQLVVPEARVEHASLKKLITEVEAAAEDVEFEARVQVMCEYTRHHANEEEKKMFPKAKKSGVDMEELGEQLARRKLELLEEVTEESGQADSAMPSSLFKDRSTHAGSGSVRL